MNYKDKLSQLLEVIDNPHPIEGFQRFIDLSRDYERKVSIRYRVYKRKKRLAILKQESSLEQLSRNDINIYRETADIVKGMPSFVLWLANFSYDLAFTNKLKEWVDYLNRNIPKAM